MPRKIVEELFYVSRSFPVSNKFRDSTGGGYHDVPSKLVFDTVPEHFVEEPFCVSKCFRYPMTMCLVGENHDFLWKNFCLSVSKNFAVEPFFVSQNVWYRKMLWITEGGLKGGSITIFCQKFLSRGAEKIRRGTLLCFRRFRLSKILKPNKGISRVSTENFLFHSTEKLRREPFCVSKGFASRKLLCLKRKYPIFYRKLVVSEHRKIPKWNPSVFHKTSGIEKFYG